MSRKHESIYLVILAGGTGSRLWPCSRHHKPKQFQDILGIGKSLLQMTYERFNGICPPANVFVITHQDYLEHVTSQLPDLSPENIILEPFRRNTAPCIAYATHKIAKLDPDATCIVTPSDHLVLHQEPFTQTLNAAVKAAIGTDRLITIGLQPTRPDTGFGYIQLIEDGQPLKKVKTFTEKPEKSLALKFLESGDFVWNSGIFVWTVGAITQAMSTYLGDLNDGFEAIKDALNTDGERDAVNRAYAHITNTSIDRGILEKSSEVYVVLGEFDWSDLGSWEAVHNITTLDEDHNAVRANALLVKTTNTMVKGPKDTLIVVHGLDNYLVSLSNDVLVVCKRDEEDLLRRLMAEARTTKGKKFL